MSTATAPLHPALLQELQHPHEAALAALREDETGSFPAVTWTATHLAAVARVLHPAARRLLPHPRAELREAVAADHALQQSLWWLDRRLTGDARVSHHAVADLQAEVAAALARHAHCELALVEALGPRITLGDQEVLAARLASALRAGPTRPHPGAPVHGPLSRVAFRVDAGADHVRDLLDSRSQPTPHDEPAHRAPGRWGSYVLGVPYRRHR